MDPSAQSPSTTSASESLDTGSDVERVFLRLVMADCDQKLQRFTDNHLTGILSLAGRQAVLLPQITELLTHYSKRVKTNLEISFPVEKLVELFQGDNVTTSNLALMYLKYARDRISPETQVSLVPVFIQALCKKPHDFTYSFDILLLCMRGLQKLSSMDKEKWPKIDVSTEATPILVRLFRCVLAIQATNAEAMHRNAKLLWEAGVNSRKFSCPSLSPDEYSLAALRLADEVPRLTEFKVAVIRLLSNGFLDEMAAFPLLVLGSSAGINAVDDAAESALKKVDIQKCVDDKAVVHELMALYLGKEAENKSERDQFMKAMQPGNVFLKQKTLGLFTRSKTAPTTYMDNVKVCLDGAKHNVVRVQTAALMFLHAVIEKMPPSALNSLGTSLFVRLRTLFQVQASTPQCWVFRCLGALGKALPSLVFTHISLVGDLLRIIPKREEDVGYAIVDCLTSWLPAFCSSTQPQDVSDTLRMFIAEHVTHDNTKCRLVALKYAEALINENEMDLKWMLLHASGDSRDEMRQEATRLLELSLRRAVPPLEFAIEDLWSRLANDVEDDDAREKSSSKQVYNASIHQMCAKYIWAVSETVATRRPAELRIVEGDDHWTDVAPLIVKQLQMSDSSVILKATKMALYAVRETLDVHQFRIAACFVSALKGGTATTSHSEELLASRFPVALAACLHRVRDSTRIELSQAICFLVSLLVDRDAKVRRDMYHAAVSDLDTKSSIAGLCWTAAASVCVVPPRRPSDSDDDMRKLALSFADKLYSFAADGYERPSSMLEASLGALGYILCNYEKLTIDLRLNEDQLKRVVELCEKIASSRKDSLAQRAREAAVRVIGWVAEDLSDDAHKGSIEVLYRIGEGPPQPELQLSVGEAMVDAAMGPHATSRRQPYLTAESDIKLGSIESRDVVETIERRLMSILTTIVAEKMSAGNHHLRRSALVWLLVVFQKATRLGLPALCEDKECLLRIQHAFADGLTENDDFSQDIASKGLGLVYSLADVEQRKQLVAGLMGALTEGRRTERKIDANTVVFAEGQLGKSPTGDNLTTYKELCSLATDLNQPDLVYKFMQLAKHNATWNSKKGAAHGFGAVLEQARDELEPYMAQLVPKLFRYRYDPDVKVQASMRSIWAVVTQSRRNVVDEFADAIADELRPALTNTEWRVRESACVAFSDLLRGHDTPHMHDMVCELFETIMRVRDDVKESVRLAAEKTADALRKLIIKMATSTNAARAEAFLSDVIPVIVDRGLNTSIKSNRAFCLAMLLEMSKTAGRQLRPYLPTLVPTFLDAVSENESSVLNYLAARSDTTQLEALDDARAHHARTSPMMAAIYDLLPNIDDDVLVSMTPRLAEQLRGSVGVSTRSAAAQLVVQLSLRAPQLLMVHRAQVDKLFQSLLPGVRDRNPSIRKQFANAISYLAKFASPGQMTAMVNGVVKDLLGADEERKHSARHVLRNLSANCAELLAGHATQVVPYVFLETCQPVVKGDAASEKRHAEWAELWADLVPSTFSAARLYKNEILSTAIDIIKENEVWSVRSQAATMIAMTADVLGGSSGHGLDVANAEKTVNDLLPTLSGRIWAGKEEILKAISAIVAAGGDAYKQSLDDEKRKKIAGVLQGEASKRNVDYASCALCALAGYAAAVNDVDAATWIAEKVGTNVAKATAPKEPKDGSDSDDATSGMTNLEKEIRTAKIVTANLTALAVAIRAFTDGAKAAPLAEQLCDFMCNSSIAWKSKQQLVAEIFKGLEKWKLEKPMEASRLTGSLFALAEEMIDQQKRTVAAEALQVIVRMADHRELFVVNWTDVAHQLRTSRASIETGIATRDIPLPMGVE